MASGRGIARNPRRMWTGTGNARTPAWTRSTSARQSRSTYRRSCSPTRTGCRRRGSAGRGGLALASCITAAYGPLRDCPRAAGVYEVNSPGLPRRCAACITTGSSAVQAGRPAYGWASLPCGCGRGCVCGHLRPHASPARRRRRRRPSVPAAAASCRTLATVSERWRNVCRGTMGLGANCASIRDEQE
jgi:hypothetical protein